MQRSYKHDYADIKYRIKNKIWSYINPASGSKGRHLWLYRAWYHALFGLLVHGNSEHQQLITDGLYMTQESHKASGIGVNVENIWSGFCCSKYFNLKYAYSPLPDKELDDMLSMGDGEEWAQCLLENGYRKVRLPYFSNRKESETEVINKIIRSYSGEKAVFYLEDQQTFSGKSQFLDRDELIRKFWNSKSRKSDIEIYKGDSIHIAAHIRRGDVGEYQVKPGMEEWWLDNSYYIEVLDEILRYKEYNLRSAELYIVSEGKEDMFIEIQKYAEKHGIEVHYVLNETTSVSWLYMIKSDILLTGSSSFSFTASFFHKGLKVSPKNRFKYPTEKNWLVADRNGKIITIERG